MCVDCGVRSWARKCLWFRYVQHLMAVVVFVGGRWSLTLTSRLAKCCPSWVHMTSGGGMPATSASSLIFWPTRAITFESGARKLGYSVGSRAVRGKAGGKEKMRMSHTVCESWLGIFWTGYLLKLINLTKTSYQMKFQVDYKNLYAFQITFEFIQKIILRKAVSIPRITFLF